MLLNKLYRFNKLLFVFVFGWLLFFVVINVKWGMVASPVYQYGMFSSVHTLSDTQSVYRLIINSKVLNPSSLSFAERDVLYVSLERFELESINNAKVFNAVSPFLNGVTAMDKRFFNNLSIKEFAGWYISKVIAVTGKPVNQLEVYKDRFVMRNGNLELVDAFKIPYFE